MRTSSKPYREGLSRYQCSRERVGHARALCRCHSTRPCRAQVIIADVVLNELKRVLKHKIHLPGEQIQEILAFLESQTVQPKPISPFPIPVRDEDDQWVLASALAAKADVLVTGDKDLLDVAEEVRNLTITDPRGFWNLAKKRPKE